MAAQGSKPAAERVTLVTGRRGPAAAPQRLAALEERGINVMRGPVTAYRHKDGQIRSLGVRSRS